MLLNVPGVPSLSFLAFDVKAHAQEDSNHYDEQNDHNSEERPRGIITILIFQGLVFSDSLCSQALRHKGILPGKFGPSFCEFAL